MHLTQGEGVGHAQGLVAVVKEGDDVKILLGEGLAQERLVGTVERAGSELASGVHLEDSLDQVTALSRRGLSGTNKLEFLFGRVGSRLDLDLLGQSGDNARVSDGLRHPRLVVSVLLGEIGEEQLVNGLTSGHQSVAEVRVLVKFVLVVAVVHDIFVIVLVGTRLELLEGSASSILKRRLEDNLGRTTTKVENGRGGALLAAAEFVVEVVDGDPSEEGLVHAVHDLDTLVLIGNNGEGIVVLKMSSNLGEDSLGLLLTDATKTSSSLDGNGSAALELIGNTLHGDSEKRIQGLSGGVGVIFVLAETTNRLFGHLEVFLLQFGGRTAVVELVDVDSGASAASVDHEDILNDGLVAAIRLGALVGAVGRIGRRLATVGLSNGDWR